MIQGVRTWYWKCGHGLNIVDGTPDSMRDWSFIRRRDCPDCVEARRRAVMNGTIPRRMWGNPAEAAMAERIRRGALEAIDGLVRHEQDAGIAGALMRVRRVMCREDDPQWWIDNRTDPVGAMIERTGLEDPRREYHTRRPSGT